METIQCPNCLALNPEDSQYCSKCGSSLEEKEETISYAPDQEQLTKDRIHYSPGENLGRRYTIIEEIGRGGMGRVYKAEDHELGTTVALKIIKPKHSQNKRFIERFKKETLLARSISHENVIRIHDIGEVEGTKYISMDYIKGQSLRDLIHSSGKLTVETALKITFDICEALKAAHKKGIIHRDLKPQNIMIDKNGSAYVMDFGLAKASQVQEVSSSGAIVGTPQYMSPEQARGEKADKSSDIYAVGTIMYEMLTGRSVFEAHTTQGYLNKHLYEKPVSPSKLNPRVPDNLEKIILKSLEKDRNKRYKSIDVLINELSIQTEEIKPQLLTIRTKKWALPIFVITILLCITIFLFIWKKGHKSDVSPTPDDRNISAVVMYFENNTGDENLQYLSRALQNYLIIDLAQSKYLRVLPHDRLFQLLEDLGQQGETKYSTQVLKQIADKTGYKYFILGNYGKLGNNYWLSLRIREANSEELLATKRVEGTGLDHFNAIIDELTPWIKANFNLTSLEIASDIDRKVGQITTNSPQAFKLYIEGNSYLQERQFEKSIKALENAIEIDPEFAMAYKSLATTYRYRGNYPHKVKEYLQKAFELKDRVSLREQHLIEALYLDMIARTPAKSIQSYQKVLEYYPDDAEAITGLASIYRNMEEWDSAVEYYKRLQEVDPIEYHDNLPYIFMAMGRYKEAREHVENNQDLYPNQPFFHRMLCYISFCQGNINLALREAEKAFSLEPEKDINTALLGNIYQVKGDIKRARDYYQSLLSQDNPESQTRGKFWMGHLHLSLGEYNECLEECVEGIAISQKFNLKHDELNFILLLNYLYLQLKNFQSALDTSIATKALAQETMSISDQFWALHYQGLSSLKMNGIAKARESLRQLKDLIDQTEDKSYIKHYYHLEGMIALENKQSSQALELFKSAYSALPQQKYYLDDQAFYLNSLARAYYISGDAEKARETYKQIISLTTGRLQWGDIYSKSFYMIGKINQEAGKTIEALENYERFLTLWHESDPEISELVEAKKQLEILRKSSTNR